MTFFKKPFVAIVLCLLIVVTSTVVSINVRLSNKCEELADSFYVANSHSRTSIYSDIVKMYELAESIIVIADNYGINTKNLVASIAELKDEINFKNPEASEVFDAYTAFYNELWSVQLDLSQVQLSQRHLEYMNTASRQVFDLKTSIDNADYNDNVRQFYKRFDRFPVNIFADIFDIEYPEYFA